MESQSLHKISELHLISQIPCSLKPGPNDRNKPTQHVATLLGATYACIWPSCCDVLQHVECCWLKFENGQIWANNTQHVATCRNMSQHGGQTHATCMLRPTMLRHVVLACCNRLAEALLTGQESSDGVPRVSNILLSWSKSELPGKKGTFEEQRHNNDIIDCDT